MPTIEDARTWRGHDAVGPDANKLGTIEDIYLDRETERAVLRELDRSARDRSLLVVTHRPGPLDLVDRVVRLDRPA